MKSLYIVLVFVLMNMGVLSAQTPVAELQKANELFRTEQYQQALNIYEGILAEGYSSKALLYNIGHAYYRLDKKGKAVLFYERALLIAPNDKQIQEDLAFVKSQLSDEIIALEVFPLISFWQSLRNSMSSNVWTALGIILFWSGIAGFILWIMGASRKRKKIGFFAGIAALVLCILPFSLAIGSKRNVLQPNKAVILTETTPLKSSPAAGSETIYQLFEGASVTTIDQIKEWRKVSLANGYQGWVNDKDLELVVPF